MPTPLSTFSVSGSALQPSGSGQTVPAFFSGLGGLTTVVPRRGWDVGTISGLGTAAPNGVFGGVGMLGHFVQRNPARMLALMGDTQPFFKRARANDLSLAFGPDNAQFVGVVLKSAVSDIESPAEDAAENETPDASAAPMPPASPADARPVEQIDAAATAALDALWDALPPEIGGLRGLQSAIYDHVAHAGFTVVECVPGPLGSGLCLIQTADPNSFRFEDRPTGRMLQQNQGGRWVDMDGDFVKAFPWDGSRDNPYGVPRWSAALAEGLRDTNRQAETDDILEQVARPRITWGFPLNGTVKFADENKGVLIGQGKDEAGNPRDLTPTEWAFMQFEATSKKMDDLRGRSSLGYMQEGSISVLDGTKGMAALDPVHQALRIRLCTALLQPLSLMNLHVGGTLAYSDTEWRVHATQLEDLRAFINGILKWAGDVHLRFLGMDAKCRVDSQPIQTSDKYKDEQAESLLIANVKEKFVAGVIADSDVAVALSGSGVVDPEKLEAWGKPPAVPVPVVAVGEPKEAPAPAGD